MSLFCVFPVRLRTKGRNVVFCVWYDFVLFSFYPPVSRLISYQKSLFFFVSSTIPQMSPFCLFPIRLRTKGRFFYLCLVRFRTKVVLSACSLLDFVLFANVWYEIVQKWVNHRLLIRNRTGGDNRDGIGTKSCWQLPNSMKSYKKQLEKPALVPSQTAT